MLHTLSPFTRILHSFLIERNYYNISIGGELKQGNAVQYTKEINLFFANPKYPTLTLCHASLP